MLLATFVSAELRLFCNSHESVSTNVNCCEHVAVVVDFCRRFVETEHFLGLQQVHNKPTTVATLLWTCCRLVVGLLWTGFLIERKRTQHLKEFTTGSHQNIFSSFDQAIG